MKARDYAKKFLEDTGDGISIDDAERWVLQDMIREMRESGRLQQIKENESRFAVYEEIDEKWRAFCRIVNREVHSDLFLAFFLALNPEEYDGWMSHRRISKFERNSGRNIK